MIKSRGVYMFLLSPYKKLRALVLAKFASGGSKFDLNASMRLCIHEINSKSQEVVEVGRRTLAAG